MYSLPFLNIAYLQDCDCFPPGCEKCEVELSLSVKNTDDAVLHVTSRDLVCTSGSMRDDEVRPVPPVSEDDPGILIVKLARNQELKLTAVAKMVNMHYLAIVVIRL